MIEGVLVSSNKVKSILSEISNFVPDKNKHDMLEMRANHILSSILFLFESIDEYYSPEEAEQLKRRFLGSIKNGDPDKFTRHIRRIKENKNG